jgi:phospholipid/cholesterol/gamma-HCH transport system substrate-binding protein
MAQTAVPYNLQDVINEGTRQLEALDSAALAKSLSVLADTLRRSEPELGPALRGITRFSAVVSRRSDQFRDLVRVTRQVSNDFTASSGDLVDLMKTGNLLLDELTRRRAAIHALLVNVASLSRTVSRMVAEVSGDLAPTLRDLHVVMRILQRQEKTLARTIHTTAISSRYTANAYGNGPWLDIYVPDGNIDSAQCAQGDC